MIYFLEESLCLLWPWSVAMGDELEVLIWSQIDAEAAGTWMVEVERQGNQSLSRELRASALCPGLEARFPARRRVPADQVHPRPHRPTRPRSD